MLVCDNGLPTPSGSPILPSYWTKSNRHTSFSHTSLDEESDFTKAETDEIDPSDPCVTDVPTLGLSGTEPAPDTNSSKKPFPDKQIFDSLSPAEFTFILYQYAEREQDRISAKLVYDTALCKLIAIAPYPIHGVPLQHLLKRINRLLIRLLSSENEHITWKNHFNLAIENESSVVIPDFHLDLHPCRPSCSRAIPIWVGECGFSLSEKEMERQLELATTMVPKLDFAIMVSIREQAVHLPSHNHPLYTLPPLSRSDFTPSVPPEPNSLDPVVVRGITWLTVKSVDFRMFLRGADGKFNFKKGGPLYAQGTLFPRRQMDGVDRVLNSAVSRLILQFAQTMEKAGAEPTRINHIRMEAESVTFSAEWSVLLEELQSSLCDTAHSRYSKWLRTEPKRKGDDTLLEAPSAKRVALTCPSPSTSHHIVAKQTVKKHGKTKSRSHK
ncbi:hypothetical protein L210DRAFT_3651255 [Boletus edulis BED1]|uniref:Uncharacterized protein n=1 Tax=Boletus edulis BED1 TaxID=1328754 RepID=A0AAD4BHL8_BOLED|nr:hypothetical protein L210DRAFT_3651255 [Boletus edulis BED1]